MVSVKSLLMEKTSGELREICRNCNIIGVMKQRKDQIVEEIEKYLRYTGKSLYEVCGSNSPSPTRPQTPPQQNQTQSTPSYNDEEPEVEIVCEGETLIHGSAVDSLKIKISSGAASGYYNVVGTTVRDVFNNLKQILNIDDNAKIYVNGEEETLYYILNKNDSLEFLKPSGSKSKGE